MQGRFKSNSHDIYTIKANKIVLSSNDDKKYEQLVVQKHLHMDHIRSNR